jgi:hypothetical protein
MRTEGGLFETVDELAEYEDYWRPRMKRFQARMCWHKRQQLTPSGRGTWGEWFERRWKQTLEEYAKEMKK